MRAVLVWIRRPELLPPSVEVQAGVPAKVLIVPRRAQIGSACGYKCPEA